MTEHEETTGMVLGIRLIEEKGDIYYVEAELSAYVDEPGEIGATLVFHPLAGLDPTSLDEEMEWPAWPLDIDDDLTRRGSDSTTDQLRAILDQLRTLPDAKLIEYLGAARMGADEAEG